MVRVLANDSVKIFFSPSPHSIRSVAIETPRLRIQSATKADLENYKSLFENPKVMEKFATGKTKDAAYVEKWITVWENRWSSGDPFSGFAVFHKESGEFIGHVILGHGDLPGQSELAFLFLPQFWNKGYGKEAISAILEQFAPELVRLGYQVDGAALHEITSTTRVDNTASNRILQVHMRLKGQEEKYGALRNVYTKEVGELGCVGRMKHCVQALFERAA